MFFLREHGFDIEDRFCRFDWACKSIIIDKESGVCTFSDGITVCEKRDFILHDAHSLSQIHVCRELLIMGITDDIEIILPETKATQTTPDVLVGKWGIFIPQGSSGGMEMLSEMRTKLKLEGKLDRFSLYSYSFDREVGGECSALSYITLK